MTLEQAMERIRQLEQMFLALSVVTPPEQNNYSVWSTMIQIEPGDYALWRATGQVNLTQDETDRSLHMFPRIHLNDPPPAAAYVEAKKKLMKEGMHYGRFVMMDDCHIGIQGLPQGADLRGLIADEVQQSYDLGRDAQAWTIKGHIPRQAIEDRKR